MSKIHPEIWRSGNSFVEGFIDPRSELLYLCNKETAGEYGIVILSVEQLAEIIAAHQKRLREHLRSNSQ